MAGPRAGGFRTRGAGPGTPAAGGTTGRQAARLVDKIMKGTRPGDIPVESNSRIELAVNATTAERLGLRVPATIQARADRVIR